MKTNGNITEYLDENGASVVSVTYDEFGNFINTTGDITQFRHYYSTKYYDHETSLYYYGYRFYSPSLHRFLNRDPIEEDGGLNLYAFCGNNPVNKWDYLGMEGVYVKSPDKNGGDVKTIDDIKIIESTVNRFEMECRLEKGQDGECKSIYITVVIKINRRLPEIQPKDTITAYKSHVKSGNDGLGIFYNGVKGSAKAHEKGHAETFIKYMDELKRVLEIYVGQAYNQKSIREAWNSIMESEKYNKESANDANKKTIEFFMSAGF